MAGSGRFIDFCDNLLNTNWSIELLMLKQIIILDLFQSERSNSFSKNKYSQKLNVQLNSTLLGKDTNALDIGSSCVRRNRGR